MARLIDADALLEKTQFRLPVDNIIAECYSDAVRIHRENIEEAPTVDAVPVVHGAWHHAWCNDYDDWQTDWECSECGRIMHDSVRTAYCPNCGAKMDLEDEHEMR